MSYKPTKIINYLLIALGLVALFFIWQTDTTTQQTALSDNTGLGINQDNTPSDLSEDKENQEEIQNNIKQSDYRIVISSIGVDMAIILGDDEKNALLQGAWHIPGSGTPDDTDGYKNIVISGHRYLYTSGPNTFFNLDKIQTEDIIQIFWQNQEYKYQGNKYFRRHWPGKTDFIYLPSSLYYRSKISNRGIAYIMPKPLKNRQFSGKLDIFNKLMSQEKIKKIRQDIDKIDNQIVDLLANRLDLVKKLAVFKSIKKIKDSQREKQIIDRLSAQSSLNNNLIKQTYSIIFTYSIKELKTLLKK